MSRLTKRLWQFLTLTGARLDGAACKEMVNATFENNLEQGLVQERRLFQILAATEDKKEGMAANLAKGGYEVYAFDLSGEALARAGEAGCHPVSDAAQAVQNREAVVTMLPAGAHVRKVYENEIIINANPGTLVIDCSTIDVDNARDVATMAEAEGLVPVDAPASGGIAAANGGTLTFVVGGSNAEPILSDMSKAVIHAGGNGAGQAAKIYEHYAEAHGQGGKDFSIIIQMFDKK